MSLQDKINELFLLDKQVRGLSSRLNSASRREQAQQKKYDQLDQQRQEISQQLVQSKAKAADLESQSKAVDDKVSQLRGQMNTVHNNKQYSALLLEVNALKETKSKLEDEALGYLSSVDELTQKQNDIQEKQDQQQKLLESSQQEVAAARSQVGEKLDQAQAQRNEAAKQLDPDSLSLFERLADEYDGEALAEVDEADRRRMEYTCGGCFISLPIEFVNTLMTKSEEIVTCPNCKRILYIDKTLKDSLRPK